MKIRKQLDIDVDSVRIAMKKTKSRSEFQRLQAILLRATRPDFDVKQMAEVVCLAVPTIWNIFSKMFKSNSLDSTKETRGGRHNSNLSSDEERELLQPFFEKAINSGIITVSEIKLAYEQKLGRQVHKSVIYRMLARHNWRKIVPVKSHPKKKPEAQAAFKKTFQI